MKEKLPKARSDKKKMFHGRGDKKVKKELSMPLRPISFATDKIH